jgi:hypothetical protein
MNTSRSAKLGTIFSMPMTVISVLGRVRHIRPLPSDSTTASVPVSATPKFAPLTATFSRIDGLDRAATLSLITKPEAGELTDEPRVLAMAARAHLRRKFLSAPLIRRRPPIRRRSTDSR